jgi:hypothetical protein
MQAPTAPAPERAAYTAGVQLPSKRHGLDTATARA